MPTYEYACKRCDERLEVFQSFSAKPLRTHEGCGGELKKVIHPRGVVFKGSGFYVTDSRKSSNGASKPASNGSKADTAEKSSESAAVSDAADD